MSSMSTNTYLLGATTMNVGLSAAAVFEAPQGYNGGWFKSGSGGSLFLGSGLSQTPGTGMYFVASEVINFSGPARFYLYATGATAVVHVGLSYSAGMSLPFAG